jgi:hypothetical protein
MRLSFALLATLFAACVGETPPAPGDAEAWCDEQRTANEGCFEDATYDECVACYNECGKPCPVAESCPVQYPGCG